MFRRSVTRVPWAAVPYSSPQRHSSALAKPLYNPDQPYPIWFFDPDGPAYAAALSVARNSSLILESLHDVTGLPWWGTIAAGSLLIRVFFFPVNVYSLRNASRFFDAKPDIQALQRSHRSALVALGPAATPYEKFQVMKIYMQGVHAALRKQNCYPWRTFGAPVLMTPFFFASVMGARHLVLTGDESFETGGLSWFTDLTLSDPSYVLPTIAISLSYAVLEVGFGRSTSKGPVSGGAALLQGTLVDKVKSCFQMALIAGIPLSIDLPAGIFVGWISSSVWSLLYLKAIRAPATYKLITGRDIPRREDADMQDVFAIKTKLITAEEDENVLPTPSVKEGNSTS